VAPCWGGPFKLSRAKFKAPPQTGWPLAGVAPLNLAELSLHAYPGINPCLGGRFLGFAHKKKVPPVFYALHIKGHPHPPPGGVKMGGTLWGCCNPTATLLVPPLLKGLVFYAEHRRPTLLVPHLGVAPCWFYGLCPYRLVFYAEHRRPTLKGCRGGTVFYAEHIPPF
jgi:hypothetical protein